MNRLTTYIKSSYSSRSQDYNFFLEVSLNSLSRVDFPVPALPVMKKLSPEFSSTSSVFLNELFNIKGSFIMPVYFFVNEMKTGKWSLNP